MVCRVWVVDGDGVAPLAARAPTPPWIFTWGRRGVLARELAWAVLFDATADTQLADDWCCDVAGDIVARLPSEDFSLTAVDVLGWLWAGGLGDEPLLDEARQTG